MNDQMTLLTDLARLSVAAPREGARRILAMNPSMQVRWWLLILVSVVSAILTQVAFSLLPVEVQALMGDSMGSPVRSAALQGVVLLIGAGLIARIGRWRRGRGSFADALLLVGWLQFLLLGLQVLQLVLQVPAPFLAELVSVAGVVLFLWLLTNFVAELHGFRSLWSVFFGIMGVIFALAFVVALFLVGYDGTGA